MISKTQSQSIIFTTGNVITAFRSCIDAHVCTLLLKKFGTILQNGKYVVAFEMCIFLLRT